eukprot:TRINITY_DN6059_c0_g1_i1.p1 TRINITY_DN6059_c0_g1~~TRINITY_DN6059_c0_g1_i1.p1  ORF type:complete len:362 (-),score=66.91 TRINITY_DN6059_c0_g1_i1:172-1257(-)
MAMARPMQARKKVFRSTLFAAWLIGALTLGRLVHEFLPIGAPSRQLRTSMKSRGGEAVRSLPSTVRLEPHTAASSALPGLSGLASAALGSALAAAIVALGVATLGLHVEQAAPGSPVHLPNQLQEVAMPCIAAVDQALQAELSHNAPQAAKDILPFAATSAAMITQATGAGIVPEAAQTKSSGKPALQAAPTMTSQPPKKPALVVRTPQARYRLIQQEKPFVPVLTSQEFRFRQDEVSTISRNSPQKPAVQAVMASRTSPQRQAVQAAMPSRTSPRKPAVQAVIASRTSPQRPAVQAVIASRTSPQRPAVQAVIASRTSPQRPAVQAAKAWKPDAASIASKPVATSQKDTLRSFLLNTQVL